MSYIFIIAKIVIKMIVIDFCTSSGKTIKEKETKKKIVYIKCKYVVFSFW